MSSKQKTPASTDSTIHKMSVSILKSAGIGGMGHFVYAVLNFINNIMLTRYLGPEFYGVFVLSNTLISYLILLSLLGMETTMLKLISEYLALKDTPRVKGSFYSGISTSLLFSIAIGTAIYFATDFIAANLLNKPEITPVFKLLILSLPFSVVARVLLGTIHGANAIKYRVLIERIALPAFRALAIVSVILLDLKVTGLAKGYVLVAITASVLCFYYLTLALPHLFSKEQAIIEGRRIRNLAATLFSTKVFQQILAKLDIVIIGYFLPAAMVGIYSAVSRIPPLIVAPVILVNLGFAPMISAMHARAEHEELSRQLKITTKWIITTSLPVMMLLIIFAPEILAIFGKDFVAGSKVMIILCLGFFADAATGSSGYMLIMTKHAKSNLINSIITSFSCIILNIILIPKYGLIGAAIASTTSLFVQQILRLAEMKLFLRIQPYSLDTVKPVCSGIVASAVVYLLHWKVFVISTILSACLTIFVFAGIYLLILRLLGFSAEDEYILNKMKEKIVSLVNKKMGA